MKPIVVDTLRSRGFAACVHAGFWIIFYLALTSFRGRAPDLHELMTSSIAPRSPVPVARLESLFSSEVWPRTVVDTNYLNPFYTRYFVPPATPSPPPPTTRKIELTYQGFYQTQDQPRQAIVKLGEAFLVASVGSKLTANLFAADATMQTLSLTNSTAQTNVLLLNTKKELEVPIQ